ncbi:MAG: hypothetical protein Q4G43_05540 [Mobilicoccus sp.]|nr:hypothetical protein [Mobilicoccus sp.]
MTAARSATGTASAAVGDRAGAVLASGRVDHLILRSPDPDLAADIVATASAADTTVEVWLDLAVDADGRERLRADLAQRLAVPGGVGHETLRDVTRRLGLSSLRGDVETAYARGRVEDSARSVPDELLDAVTVCVDDLPRRVRAYADAGVAGLTVRLAGDENAAPEVITALATAARSATP